MLHIYMHIRYIAEALNVTSYFWHGSVMFNGCVETAVSFGKIENNNSTISRSLLVELGKDDFLWYMEYIQKFCGTISSLFHES